MIALFATSQTLTAGTGLPATNVKTLEIVPKKLNIYKSYIGHLKPQNRVVVRSETSGTVEKINFEEGQRVQAGEVLVHVSTNELELRKIIAETNYSQAVTNYQIEKALYMSSEPGKESAGLEHVSLKQLRLQKEMAKADYEHALSEYNVQKRLFEKKMTSATVFDTHKTNLEIKRIKMEQAALELDRGRIQDRSRLENLANAMKIAEVNLNLARLELDKSKVKAPFTGIVKKKTVQMGGFIQNGMDLLEIMNISKVKAKINIPEKEMRYAKLGKRVSVRLDAYPQEQFSGTIKTLGLEADIKCRCFPAEVEIDNPKQALLPGMMARLEMLAISEPNQVIIPRHAVLEREHGSIVFVEKDGVAVQQPVKTGEMIQEDVQVISGLKKGDRIIVVGQDLLTHNEPVNVVKSSQKIAWRR